MQKNYRGWAVGTLCIMSLLALPAGLVAQEAAQPTEAAAVASDALLQAIPADATAFMAIRNLKELDSDIVALSVKLGFPLGPEGMFPAPLEWLKGTLQITDGLNDAAGAALVLLDSRNVKTFDELPDRLVMYIPATDPEALLKSLGAEEAKEGVYKLDLAGSPSMAGVKGKYVLVVKAPAEGAATPDALAAAMRAEGEGVASVMAPDRVKAYAKQDICIWLNLRNVSAELRTQIADGLQQIVGLMGAMGGGMGAQSAPADNDVAVNLNKFIEQGEELNVALLLDARTGLGLTFYSRVKPDSDAAKMIAATPSLKGSILMGLPDQAPIFAMGAAVAVTDDMLKQIRKTVDNVVGQIAKLDATAGSPLTKEGLKPLIDTYMDLLANTQGVAVSVSNLAAPPKADKDDQKEEAQEPAPQPAPVDESKGTIGLTAVLRVKDAKASRDQLRKAFDQVKQLAAGVAKADGTPQEKVDQVLNAFTWQENATTIEEASVDQIAVELEKLPDVKPEQIAQVKKIVGQEGIVLRVATVGENVVVINFGGGSDQMTEIIKLVKANDAPLAKNKDMAKVLARMPKGRIVMEAFLDFQNLLGIVDTIATRMGTPLPVKLSMKGALPLAITTINVDKTAQEINVLIPAELITSAAEMVRQQLLPMIMMGGLGGGGGGMPPGAMDQNDQNGQPDAEKDSAKSDEDKPKAPARPKRRPDAPQE